MKDREVHRILIVDDSASALEVMRRNLTAEGYSVLTSTTVPEAVALLEADSFDLVITDFKMPKVSGLDLIRHVRENLPETEVMMVTGYATIEGAIDAVKTGAEEYLSKPFTDEELKGAVERSLDKLRLRRRVADDQSSSPRPQGLVGESPPIQRVFRAIQKAAKSDATVLIYGESGTGKELVARGIHYQGHRCKAPFVPVNCGGIPEGLLESELFGHVRGAFTGANETRAGFFQTADGGSIFLDEISETSLTMQVKLLRVLQDKEVHMVGGNRARRVDVRIIAATNKNLEELVANEAFRRDLYFRINVIDIALPPLRERGDDVILLARHFTQKFAQDLRRTPPAFSEEAMEILRAYCWPGNVRELENLVHRLVVMSDGRAVDVPDLPPQMRFNVAPEKGLDRSLAEVEAEHIRNVLAAVKGNKTQAAHILGIDRKTLREKLRRYDLG